MKNLNSKLFGGLAAVAMIIGSFTATSAESSSVSINEICVEATDEMNTFTESGSKVWICGKNFCVYGTPTDPTPY